MCSNCQANKVYARGRCYACWKYYNRTNKERPKKLWFKILGRHEKGRPKWCKNCGSPKVVANLRCEPCRTYLRRHGKERPKHLSSDYEQLCRICTKPLERITKTGYCTQCRKYRNQSGGKERPRHLWGIGEFGWCECGNPATVQSVEFGGLCAICHGEESRTTRAFSRIERGERWQ